MGGLEAISALLPAFSADFSLPILITQHQGGDGQNNGFIEHYYNQCCQLRVVEAKHGDIIRGGTVYLSVPGYHLQVELDGHITLSIAPPVSYAIPSVDVLFETAAEYYRKSLVGVVLTGMNHDGVAGLKAIKGLGGFAVVQDPDTAVAKEMPASAIAGVAVDKVLALREIGPFLAGFNHVRS